MGREREALAEARPTGSAAPAENRGAPPGGSPRRLGAQFPGIRWDSCACFSNPFPSFHPPQKSIPRRSFPVVPGDEGARISVFLTAEVPEVSPNFFSPQGSCCLASGVKGGRKRELGKGPRGNASPPCVSRDHLETLGSLPPHTIFPLLPPTPAFLLD